MVNRKRNTAEDFWKNVDVRGTDECWQWKGLKVNNKGYGVYAWNGGKHPASRLAWILTAQITPPRHLFACHKCNNPPCCNPNHLYLGTQSDNMRDAVVAGTQNNARKTHCKNGHEYTPENTCVRPVGSRSFRVCRQCERDRFAARWKIILSERSIKCSTT